MLRTRTCIKNHFTIRSCFEVIHFPWSLCFIIHFCYFNSRKLIWTFIHYTSQLLVLLSDQSICAVFKLIDTLLLQSWWISVSIKVRVITTNTLWKIIRNTIDTSSVIALLAIVSIVHWIVLSPMIVRLESWRSSVVKLILVVTNSSFRCADEAG